jgi:hypothetical protein
VSTIEELLEKKVAASVYKTEITTTRHSSICQKFALTSPTSGGRSIGIVCSWTQATEFVCFAKETSI